MVSNPAEINLLIYCCRHMTSFQRWNEVVCLRCRLETYYCDSDSHFVDKNTRDVFMSQTIKYMVYINLKKYLQKQSPEVFYKKTCSWNFKNTFFKENLWTTASALILHQLIWKQKKQASQYSFHRSFWEIVNHHTNNCGKIRYALSHPDVLWKIVVNLEWFWKIS